MGQLNCGSPLVCRLELKIEVSEKVAATEKQIIQVWLRDGRKRASRPPVAAAKRGPSTIYFAVENSGSEYQQNHFEALSQVSSCTPSSDPASIAAIRMIGSA